MLSVLLTLLAQNPVDPSLIREGECYAMVQRDGRVVSTRVPGFYVIGATAAAGPLAVALPRRDGGDRLSPVEHHPGGE